MASRDTLEFDKELHALKIPTSASRIQSITKLAIKHSEHYKNIVFSIEKFLSKCSPELKLAGIYVVDSIARAASKASSTDPHPYITRISEKLPSMFQNLTIAPSKDKQKIMKLLVLWKKSNIFSSDALEEIINSFSVDTPQKQSTPPPSLTNPSTPVTTPALALDAAAVLSSLANISQPSLPPPPTIPQSIPALFNPAALLSTLFQNNNQINNTINSNQQSSNIQSQNSLAQLLGLSNNIPIPSKHDPTEFDYDDEDDGLNSKPAKLDFNEKKPLNFTPTNNFPIFSPTYGNPMNAFNLNASMNQQNTQIQPSSTQFQTSNSIPGNSYNQPPANQYISTPTGNPMNPYNSANLNNPYNSIAPPPNPFFPMNAIPEPNQFENSSFLRQQQNPRDNFSQPPPPDDSFDDRGFEACAEPRFHSSLAPDFIQILSRTIYVGGVKPEVNQARLSNVFETEAGVQVESIIINYSKFSAFVKLATRRQAERAREKLKGYLLEGYQLKTGWALGYGPKDLFDNNDGTVTIPFNRLTELDIRALTHARRGGMRNIQPGYIIEEPEVNVKEYGHGGGVGRIGSSRPKEEEIEKDRHPSGREEEYGRGSATRPRDDDFSRSGPTRPRDEGPFRNEYGNSNEKEDEYSFRDHSRHRDDDNYYGGQSRSTSDHWEKDKRRRY